MIGWHNCSNEFEFEFELDQAPGDGEGQGSPACCSPWGHKELDTPLQVNNSNMVFIMHLLYFNF